jgi:hypothetical protein
MRTPEACDTADSQYDALAKIVVALDAVQFEPSNLANNSYRITMHWMNDEWLECEHPCCPTSRVVAAALGMEFVGGIDGRATMMKDWERQLPMADDDAHDMTKLDAGYISLQHQQRQHEQSMMKNHASVCSLPSHLARAVN